MDTGGGQPSKSEDVVALEELEKELTREVRLRESALHKAELAYLQECLTPSDTLPFVGNLASGWEILLEGKNPDKKKCNEKIYSGACPPLPPPPCRVRRALVSSRAALFPNRPQTTRTTESSKTWLNYREAQERRKAMQSAEVQDRAAAAAYKVAEGAGRGGEAGRAAAAATAAAALAAGRVKKKREEGEEQDE